MKTVYTISYFHDEFVERYASQIENIDASTSDKDKCQVTIAQFGWSLSQAQLGVTKVK
jgi:chitin synthase